MRIRVKDIDTGKWHIIDVPVNQENPSGGPLAQENIRLRRAIEAALSQRLTKCTGDDELRDALDAPLTLPTPNTVSPNAC